MSDIIRRIELTNILDYVACPYRTTLTKTSTDYNIIAEIYKKTARYYFGKLLIELDTPYHRLHKFFSQAWSEEKPRFTKGIKLNTLTNLRVPLTEIGNLVRGDEEIIAYDYPLFLELGNYFLLDNVDAVVYSKKFDRINLIKLQDNIDYNTEDLRNLYTYAFMSCVTKGLEFTKEKSRFKLTIYNPYLMYYYTNSVQEKIEDYADLLTNVCSAYSSGIIYPLPGKTKCANCQAKSVCKWKYTTTNIVHKVTYK